MRFVLLALLVAGCETLVSDAATRIRYELRDSAARLQSSAQATAVVTIRPATWPDGCPDNGRYRVRLVPYRGGKQVPAADVFVKCLANNREYSTGTVQVVPREMTVEKAAGEPVRITLRKAPAGVEIAALE